MLEFNKFNTSIAPVQLWSMLDQREIIIDHSFFVSWVFCLFWVDLLEKIMHRSTEYQVPWSLAFVFHARQCTKQFTDNQFNRKRTMLTLCMIFSNKLFVCTIVHAFVHIHANWKSAHNRRTLTECTIAIEPACMFRCNTNPYLPLVIKNNLLRIL